MSEPSVREFEARYRELMSAYGARRDNVGCVECAGCSGCMGCTFCRDSERLVRCHYCVRSSMCTDCAHCRGSRGLIGCQHCIDSESCSACSYIVRSMALSHCTYCFGCIGLGGKDFHILNEPFERDAYFAVTARLMRELRL